MYTSYLLSGLLLGIFSSFHCVGMCGAIAFSLPVHTQQPISKLLSLGLYHLGRVTMYAVLGIFFGAVGRHVFIGGLQQWLSILLGVFVLIFVLVFYKRSVLVGGFPLIGNLYNWVQKVLILTLQRKSSFAMLLVGLLNALLPCGMVYLAVAGALTSNNTFAAGLFMFAFGVGTIPLMLVVSYLGLLIPISFRNNLKKAMPYAMFIVGVVLIVRGLQLNIPYLSPSISPISTQAVSCH
ncbi:MAG: sulfite exporter TauE/SafE family protein [Bacteroidetes bacterium]|nr:MAG: sulfite exporter TauE/SafE family protein [Bacteroidota bacterium]TAE62169.1 MAG: sulfite exporter TauE/SafE family protein [Bacteroidota bacterium]TAF92621.1 MAG: sulfite exporter TauE/SafE family protein [Bacteroidota bacterium]